MRRKDNLSKTVRRTDPRFDRLGAGFGDATQASIFGGGGQSVRYCKVPVPSNLLAGTSNANTPKATEKKLPTKSNNTRKTFSAPSITNRFKVTKKTPEREREDSRLRKNFLSSHCANEKRRRECVRKHMDNLRKVVVDSCSSDQEKPYIQSCTTVRLIDAAKQMIDSMNMQDQHYMMQKKALQEQQELLKAQLARLLGEVDEQDGLDGYESEETLDAAEIKSNPEYEAAISGPTLQEQESSSMNNARVNVCSAYGTDGFPIPVTEGMFFDKTNCEHLLNGNQSTSFISEQPVLDYNLELENLDTESSIYASVIKVEDFQKILEETNEFNVHEKLEYLDGCEYIALEVEV